MDNDEAWLEAGFAMAAAQYVNAFADAIGVPLDGDEERPTLVAPLYPPPSLEKVPVAQQRLLAEITDFYGGELPNAFRYLAGRGTHLKATRDYVRGTLPDRVLSRPYKTMIGFAASVVTCSPYGINFHRRELLRLGAGEEGILEVLAIVQVFEAITKVADLLLMPPEIENQDMRLAPRSRSGKHRHGSD